MYDSDPAFQVRVDRVRGKNPNMTSFEKEKFPGFMLDLVYGSKDGTPKVNNQTTAEMTQKMARRQDKLMEKGSVDEDSEQQPEIEKGEEEIKGAFDFLRPKDTIMDSLSGILNPEASVERAVGALGRLGKGEQGFGSTVLQATAAASGSPFEQAASAIIPVAKGTFNLSTRIATFIGGADNEEFKAKLAQGLQTAIQDDPVIGKAIRSAVSIAERIEEIEDPVVRENIKSIAELVFLLPAERAIEPFAREAVSLMRQTVARGARSQVDDAVRKVVQAKKPREVSAARDALAELDTRGVETYKDLANAIEDKTSVLISKQNELLGETAKELHSVESLQKATKVGNKTVKTDFITKALDDLEELYAKTSDPENYTRILEAKRILETRGISGKEVNDLAREYGREFGNKAFTSQDVPRTSVNSVSFENTRGGLKETSRGLMKDDAVKLLDEEISNLITTERLVKKMVESVDQLNAKVVSRGVTETIGRGIGKVVSGAFDTFTLGLGRGIISSIRPSNLGLKTMNSLGIQKALKKNLKQAKKLLDQAGTIPKKQFDKEITKFFDDVIEETTTPQDLPIPTPATE